MDHSKLKKIKILLFIPLGTLIIPILCNGIDMYRKIFRMSHIFLCLLNFILFVLLAFFAEYIFQLLSIDSEKIFTVVMFLCSYPLAFHTNIYIDKIFLAEPKTIHKFK